MARWKDVAYLTGCCLPNESITRYLRGAIRTQPEASDMRMSRCAILTGIALHFADLDHGEGIAVSTFEPLKEYPRTEIEEV